MSKTRFAWIWGALGFGLSSSIALAYILSQAKEQPFLPWLVLSVAFFVPGGYFWGRFMWRALGVGEGGREMEPRDTDRP